MSRSTLVNLTDVEPRVLNSLYWSADYLIKDNSIKLALEILKPVGWSHDVKVFHVPNIHV